jgi:hypothetical protein
MLYSDYQVHVMGHVPYVDFATYQRDTVRTRFTFYIKKRVFTIPTSVPSRVFSEFSCVSL